MSDQTDAQDPRDARIADLEAKLKATSERLDFQKKRALKLEAALKELSERPAAAPPGAEERYGFAVYLDGVRCQVLGDFRADNTFVEVKRGHCPEGVTLLAIDKIH